MRITFGIGDSSAEAKAEELLGFVFTCPSCKTPVSYQANQDYAVELDKNTFENFKKAMAKKFGGFEGLDGAAFTGPMPSVKTLDREPLDEDMFEHMLKDIQECDTLDDFLKRIGN
jgi:hypothetical protein